MKTTTLVIIGGLIVCGLGTSNAFAHESTQKELLAQAKVSESDARATALAKVPGGTVSSSELEKEHHRLIWSFDIAQANSKDVIEIQVSAKTGAIVSQTTESSAKEANEAAAEAKEKQKDH